jgi:outer membrane protein TolC
MGKKIVLVLFVALFGFLGFSKTVSVGMVVDGKSENLIKLANLLQKEVKDLAGEDLQVVFLPEKQIYCEFDSDKVKFAIDKIDKDKDVDMYFLVGSIASNVGVFKKEFKKPVFAGEVLNFDLNAKIPKNLYFSAFKHKFLESIKPLIKDLNYNNILVVCSKGYLNSVNNFEKLVKDKLGKNIKCDFVVWNGNNIKQLDGKLNGKDCVLFVDNKFFKKDSVDSLITYLTKKKIPVFSNEKQVPLIGGVCAFDVDKKELKIAKHLAVMFLSMLEGEEKESSDFILDEKLKLFVNSDSFSKVNCYLPFSLLLDACDIATGSNKKVLSLKRAVEIALKNNLEIAIAKKDANTEKANLKLAKGNLKPQIDLSVTGLKLDKKSTTYVLNIPENSIKGEVFLTQVIYSEDANNYIAIERYLVDAKKHKLESQFLDTMLKTCNAYLSVLKAQSILEIVKEDLKVNTQNLQFAKIRNEKGITSPVDVYRWQAVIAQTKSKLLFAKVNLKNAREEFFRVLNIKSSDKLGLKNLNYKEKMFFINNEKVFHLLKNEYSLKAFGEFLTTNLENCSPELKAYNSLIEASARELKSAKKSFFSPTVALVGSYSEIFDKWGAGTNPIPLPPEFGAMLPEISDKSWYFGVSVKFSPFKGGKKTARKIKATESLYKAKLERENLKQKLNSNLNVLVFKLRASYDSIQLAKTAKEAAYKNFKLVQNAYKEGVVEITALMDAQNAYLKAKEYYKNAIYAFIEDYLTIDRIATGFISFQDNRKREIMLLKLDEFMKKYDKKGEN